MARIIWCIKSGCTFCCLSLIIFDGRISSIHFYVRQILFPFAFDQKVDPNLVHSSIKPYIWLTSLVYLSLYSLEVGFALHELTSLGPNLKGIHVRIFVQSYFSASGLWQRRSMLRSSGKRKKKDSIFKCQILLIVRLLIQAFPQLISCLTYGHESEWTEDTKSMLHGPTISLLIQCFHFFSCTTCTYSTSFGHTTYQTS